MQRITNLVKKNLSLKISLISVLSMGLLLMATLILILNYTKREVNHDTVQKAFQTLDATIANIDNMMLTVEQTTGNIYMNLQPYLNKPETVSECRRQIMDANPYVTGCTIAFDEDYLSQAWLATVMKSGLPTWKNRSLKEGKKQEPVTTYVMPMTDRHGVITVDISLNMLSQIVLAAKPSEHSYCVLLDSDGSLIVHHDKSRLNNETVFDFYDQAEDKNICKAAQKMVAGESGYMPFSVDGNKYFVFYKPFERRNTTEYYNDDMNWSAGIVYPRTDIYGDYDTLRLWASVVAIAGLLLMFASYYTIIRRQLKPLRMLTERAKSLAKGQYNEPIPDSHHHDEIGRLQANFQKMQQRLAKHAEEVEQLTNNYRQHGEQLSAAYERAKNANKTMTDFMHNMTNQMIPPAHAIFNDMKDLADFRQKRTTINIDEMADNIERNSRTITLLLNDMLNISDNDLRKEACDD